MLGFSHAVSGAATWLAVSPAAAGLLGRSLSPAELAAGTLACAGAALIPDLDHPSATIAQTFGPVSKAVARFTALVSGGHRQGTHSFLFAGMFGAFCYLVALGSTHTSATWPVLALMFCLAAFAFRGLRLVLPRTSSNLKSITMLGQAVAITWAMTQFMPATWWWLGLAGFLGCLAHLTGDALTPEGVPLFWPARWRFSLPLISHTGNVVEKALVGPGLVLLTGWLAFRTFAPLLGA